ncbi:MAG: STAS domain-containing protein [Sedimentisphaerales bacterium]|nr:STAS domain-containing protein [Sedimentisphaerales bacterium]
MDENLNTQIKTEGEAAVITFGSSAITDMEGITAACEQIKTFIEENHPMAVVFDFGGVEFFTSEVLGLLLEVRARLKEYEGRVVVSTLSPQLYRVFKVTNLDKIFEFFPDSQSALKTVSTD